MPRWPGDKAGGRPLRKLLFALVLGIDCLSARAGAAQTLPDDLYLEVVVNDQPANLITRFTRTPDGGLSADATELRNSGILPDGVATTGEVRLDQIPGLGWRLIEPEQTIRFIVPEELLAPHVLRADGTDPVSLIEDEEEAAPQIDHGHGVVLNYALNIESWQDMAGQGSGSFDARLFSPWGAMTHNFALTPGNDDGSAYRRLDSYWRSAFPNRQVQVQIGDIATRGLSWSRPVRLGGVMAERNFGLRPDLVTLPLPSFEGSAALPSTVEVFAGSVRSYAADVPAGPFRLENLPLAVGSGVARVMVRDVTGQETQLDLPFLVSDKLLGKGVADFALAAGRPRLGIGSSSDHYGAEIFGAGTLRYGLSDRVTLLAQAEGGKGLAMMGIGATVPVGHFGTTSLSYARSRTEQEEGGLIDVSTDLSIGRLRLSGRMMKTSGTFQDIAAVTADPGMIGSAGAGFPRHIAQMNISMPLGERSGAGVNLFVSDARYSADSGPDRNIGASYHQQLSDNASLTLTGLAQRGQQDDTVIGAQLHVSLGPHHHVGASMERRGGGWRQYVSAGGRSKAQAPGWDWHLQASRDEQAAVQGRAARTGALGRAEVAGRYSENSRSLGLRLEGALVAAGGGVFLSHRVDDAFAVVDAGAPGVEVRAENRPVGRTGRSGKLLVPDLRAYEDNTITIDPLGLPLDVSMDATQQVVRPAHHSGARIDFGVETSARQALVELLDSNNRPLDVGGSAALNGAESDLLVGFDGEIFVQGLQDNNQLIVSYPDGRTCQARFDYRDEPGTMTELKGVPCL